MSHLLRAGIRRYTRSPLLWLVLLGSAVCGILLGRNIQVQPYLEDGYIMAFFLILSVLFSLSIGREYSDGTLRNKLLIGYSKGKVFFSELLLGCGIATVTAAVHLLAFTCCVIGYTQVFPAYALVVSAVGFWLITLAFTAMFVVLGSLIPSKAISAIVNIAVVLIMVFTIYQFDHMLLQSEFHQIIHTENGVTVSELIPNEYYVGGFARDVLNFLFKLFPYGALIRYTEIVNPCFHSWQPTLVLPEDSILLLKTLPIYTVAVVAFATFIGYFAFRKKNFK